MHKTTFEAIWHRYLEPKAREHGVVDGDMSRVRSSVKSSLVSAGWAKPDGAVSFVSREDAKGCLTAAVGVINRVTPGLAAERQVSRAQVMAASVPTTSAPVLAALESANIVSAAFPTMATTNERCPRCQASMQPVALANDRAAVYCLRDRVVLPLVAHGRDA